MHVDVMFIATSFSTFAGRTGVDAGTTASAAVVLFHDKDLPPDRER